MGAAVNIVILVTVGLTTVVLFRTAVNKSNAKYPNFRPLEKYFPISIADGLVEAIRFPTISYDAHSGRQVNSTAFEGLHKFLFKRFSSIFKKPPEWVLHRIIGNYSILVQVRGSDPALKPYMLCAHLDVVPVDDKLWTHPPFEGYTDNTHIWGRGALDDKHNVMAQLEALSLRISRHERPRRGFFIALGHDEEIRGLSGAKTIAKYLRTLKVQLKFIMDEGLIVGTDFLKGVEAPVALIGVAEKGYLTVKVKCESSAKHASIPSKETAITTLSRALARFANDAHPAHMTKIQEDLLATAAPYASFPFDMIYSNVWLFKPLISFIMKQDDIISAQMRTTSAVTVVHGGSKENVIPNRAEALVNHRILPGYSIEDVLKHDRQLVSDIPGITVEIYKRANSEAMDSSPYGDHVFGYQQLKRTTRKIYPDAIVAPSLLMANTDTKHYFEANLTDNIYRYTPVMLNRQEIATIHGNDERISKINFRRLADFYLQLTYNCDESIEPDAGYQKSEL